MNFIRLDFDGATATITLDRPDGIRAVLDEGVGEVETINRFGLRAVRWRALERPGAGRAIRSVRTSRAVGGKAGRRGGAAASWDALHRERDAYAAGVEDELIVRAKEAAV